MKLLVVGAGMMARAVVHDLVRQPDVEAVRVCDVDAGRLRGLVTDEPSRKVVPARADAGDMRQMGCLAQGCAVVVSCVPYIYDVGLTRVAIRAGAHFCDLGGNNDVVRQQRSLDRQARQAGVGVVPDCGLAPGLVSILAADGVGRLERVDEIHLRVGGLPRRPRPPLGYGLVFSANGLINEYVEPCLVIRDGKVRTVEPLAEVETLQFPAPFGRLEAFNTSGGSSTLPYAYRGKVKTLDYKTIRYPGHCAQMRLLFDLGLTSSERVNVDGLKVVPRRLLIERLEAVLEQEMDDVVLLRVEVTGREKCEVRREKCEGRREKAGAESRIDKGGRYARQTIRYQVVDYADRRTGLTAMMRMTGFPAAIVALALGRGQVKRRGVFTGESGIPSGEFITELGRRGIAVTRRAYTALTPAGRGL